MLRAPPCRRRAVAAPCTLLLFAALAALAAAAPSAAPAPSPAAAAPHASDDFWTQEDRPAAGPIVDAPAIAAAPAPAPAATPDNDVLVSRACFNVTKCPAVSVVAIA